VKEIFKTTFPFVRLGLMWLRLRAFTAGGPSAIYHREVTRARILSSEAITTDAEGNAELHVLTGRHDWLNVLWALKSFYRVSPVKFPLAIHDDGSLSDVMLVSLRNHFPQSRVISRMMANDDVERQLAGYPLCMHFRKSNYLAQKVFDLEFYLNASRMLLFDSDLLFFRHPTVLIEKLLDSSYKTNSVNRNWGLYGYALSQDAMQKRFNINVCDSFNSGLGVIHKGVLKLDWIEEWLADEQLRNGHPHRIEQTLIAMCCCKIGCELLPSEYDVYEGKTKFENPVRHYIRPVRPLMYKEGMRYLAEAGLLGGEPASRR
jgi:hypothetical protein